MDIVEVGSWICSGKTDLCFGEMKFMKLGSKPDSFQADGDNIR